ncbi:MAG: pilus assembly PilX family protein [Gammaproteobacteria bacterium]
MRIFKTTRTSAAKRQRGAALAVSLVILLVMTMLGVAGMRMTTLEERMAGNTLDRQRAFEAAEATLLAAEAYLTAQVASTNVFDNDGSDGLYDNSEPNLSQSLAWNDSDSRAYTGDVGTKSSPRFVIQHYGTVAADADQTNLDNYGQGTGAGAIGLFRITARSTGGSGNAPVVLQSTYNHQVDN